MPLENHLLGDVLIADLEYCPDHKTLGAPYLARFSRDVGCHGPLSWIVVVKDEAGGFPKPHPMYGCPTFAPAYVEPKKTGRSPFDRSIPRDLAELITP
jgi:hypothetical protein